ncbi:hypothetical protein Tco_0615124 [Tanacetum coccineum]
MSTPIDFSGYILNGLKIKNLTQEFLLGPAFRLLKGTRSNYAELKYDFEECYKALLEKLDWENPKGGDYPFDLSKPLPLITHGKRQRVPFEYFINNDLKYLQGGVSTMTYTTSTTKKKAVQYDLPGIEDMVPNIWSRQSRGDVYSTKHILAATHVKVMRKHGYGYLEEIVVRRDDNVLYRFKEGDDVADFTIVLRMFTRSLVIQKRVKDLQLGGNRLMRSNELYKFSDGTLTRILSSIEDITKNIDMEYLPKRRWSTLEKKRAHFMIKDINKLLKERRMMRSLEKFVGVTRWFALIVLSALRRSDNENMVDPHGFEGIYKDGDGDGKLRLCLVDDLKVFKITFSHSSQDKATSSHLKSMITTSNHKLMIEVKDYELKTEEKA